MKFDVSGGLTFEGACDLVVMYDNPRGESAGYRPFVFVTDMVGNRKTMYISPATRDGGAALKGAEYLAKFLQARWDNYGRLPFRFSDWQDTRAQED